MAVFLLFTPSHPVFNTSAESSKAFILGKFNKLLNGEARLKKKRFGIKTVFTCDANEGRYFHRLIFERIQLTGKGEAFILRDIAWFHDYHKALNWKPYATLAHIPEHYSLHQIDDVALDEKAQIMVCHQGTWFKPTELQSEIANFPAMPLLVVGPPGSGKTLSALALLQEQALYYQSLIDGKQYRFLSLSPSDKLKENIASSWTCWAEQNLPAHPAVTIDFLTFSDLLGRYSYFEGASDFAQNEVLLLAEIAHRLNSKNSEESIQYYQEMKLNAHCLLHDLHQNNSFETSAYQHIGVKQSLFQDKAHLYKVYTLFMTLFHNNPRMCIPGISPINPGRCQALFDLTIVDEMQNESVQNALNALMVTRNNQVVFMGDSLQKGKLKCSSLPLLAPALHLYRNGLVLKQKELSATYRLKSDVACFANQLVLLHNTLNQGRSDKTAYSSIAYDNNNQAEQSLALTTQNQEAFLSIGSKAQAAIIIINENDRREAEEIVQSKNVFTVEEAQGLEFKEIVLFISLQTLNHFIPVAQEMRKLGIDTQTQLNKKINAPGNKFETNSHLLVYLSLLFVAISRAQGKLWLYVPLDSSKKDNKQLLHNLDPFWSWLLQHTNQNALQLEQQPSSEQEWLLAINRYLQQGLTEQAQAKLQQHLSLSKAQAMAYSQFPLHELHYSLDDLSKWMMQSEVIKVSAAVQADDITKSELSSAHSSGLVPATASPTTTIAQQSKSNKPVESIYQIKVLLPKRAAWIEKFVEKSALTTKNIEILIREKHATTMLFFYNVSAISTGFMPVFAQLVLNGSIIEFKKQLQNLSKNKENHAHLQRILKEFLQCSANADGMLSIMVCIELADLARSLKISLPSARDVFAQRQEDCLTYLCQAYLPYIHAHEALFLDISPLLVLKHNAANERSWLAFCKKKGDLFLIRMFQNIFASTNVCPINTLLVIQRQWISDNWSNIIKHTLSSRALACVDVETKHTLFSELVSWEFALLEKNWADIKPHLCLSLLSAKFSSAVNNSFYNTILGHLFSSQRLFAIANFADFKAYFYEVSFTPDMAGWLSNNWSSVKRHFDSSFFTAERVLQFAQSTIFFTGHWDEVKHWVLPVITEDGHHPLITSIESAPQSRYVVMEFFNDFAPLIQQYEINDKTRKVITDCIKCLSETYQGRHIIAQNWHSIFNRFMTADELEQLPYGFIVALNLEDISGSRLTQSINHSFFVEPRRPQLNSNDLVNETKTSGFNR